MKRRKNKLILALLTVSLLCGCGQKADDERIVLIEQEAAPVEYSMGVVTTTDVIATQNVSCVYRQVSDWNGSFEVNGKLVGKVYVKKGDIVEEGQLLAELDISDSEDKIAELNYRIKKNQIRLEYLEQERDNRLKEERFKYENYPGWAEWENKKLSEVEEAIRLAYDYEMEDCIDAISSDEAKLPTLLEARDTAKLYADMKGTITFVRNNLEGSYSREGQTVITIMDDTSKVFEVKQPEYGRYFMKDTITEMNITVGQGKGTYQLVPYAMNLWGESLLFSIAKGGDDTAISLGDSGTMKVVTGYKSQVLAVPSDAVHQADDKEFVYVVGESGLRELIWVQCGLHGKEYIEIFDGLSEGDKVVIS